MGVVYEAEHTLIARKVAIKVLAPRYAQDAGVLRRLFAEAKAVNRVRHENIVEVTDLIAMGEHSALVMEYLTGRSLEAELRGGPIEIDRLLSIASQVAGGMAAAHAAGIVHRDLKPANIYLCERGDRRDVVKILDFGASNLDVTADPEIAPLIIGTPLYFAPEAATSASSDHRADIYSFGVVLYEAATGRPPFDHARVCDLLVAHAEQKPVPPSRLRGLRRMIPLRLERLILHCLEKDPSRRPASMEVVGGELASIAESRARDAAVISSSPREALRREALPRERTADGEQYRPTQPVHSWRTPLTAGQGIGVITGVSALLVLSVIRWLGDASASAEVAASLAGSVVVRTASEPDRLVAVPGPPLEAAPTTVSDDPPEPAPKVELTRDVNLVVALERRPPRNKPRRGRVVAKPRAAPRTDGVSPPVVRSTAPTTPRTAPRIRSRLEWISAVYLRDRQKNRNRVIAAR